jgi:hypothetical protein
MAAWGDPAAGGGLSPRASAMYGAGGSGLFAGMEPSPAPQRSDGNRVVVASKEREAMDEEMRRLRVTLAASRDQNVSCGSSPDPAAPVPGRAGHDSC